MPRGRLPIYLNRLRERDYFELFTQTPGIEIADWVTEFVEGEDLLNDEVRRALPDYTDEELTKRSVIAVVTKLRGSATAAGRS